MIRYMLTLAAAALIAGCGTSLPPVERAANECGIEHSGDGTIAFDTEGNDETSGDDLDDIVCVLVELGATDAIIARIDSTSAMDGQQSGMIGERVQIIWSYHPDRGLFVAFQPA